ncbi:MAG: hypothetical protein AB7R90_17450, partial [Reyranellaceae bacterium]
SPQKTLAAKWLAGQNPFAARFGGAPYTLALEALSNVVLRKNNARVSKRLRRSRRSHIGIRPGHCKSAPLPEVFLRNT